MAHKTMKIEFIDGLKTISSDRCDFEIHCNDPSRPVGLMIYIWPEKTVAFDIINRYMKRQLAPVCGVYIGDIEFNGKTGHRITVYPKYVKQTYGERVYAVVAEVL